MERGTGNPETLCEKLENLPETLNTGLMSVIAAVSGQIHGLRYLTGLEITPAELKRYFGKSTRLALCYSGFAQDKSYGEAAGAGKAAFLSCAYDVASDWRDKSDPKWAHEFEKIVRAEASPELAEMAIKLYRNDVNGRLEQDGLERGIVALRFILEMMGLQSAYWEKTDIDHLGILLQIVDDVWDYEKDLKAGDENCLSSARRNKYLQMLVDEMHDEHIQRLFPNGGVLLAVIKRARKKAEQMSRGN
jgi:hypothetical protein